MTKARLRVAVVNDQTLVIEALRRTLAGHGHDVAWVARDGEAAVRNCALDRPDVVLMDLIMPHLDGAEATRRIMATSPCPILLVTARPDDVARVYEAMSAGALDVVATPALGRGDDPGTLLLLRKITRLARLATPSRPRPVVPAPARIGDAPTLVAVGASTGGPAALARVLEGLGLGLPAAVVLVQHIDVVFADGLATWLEQRSGFPVRLALEGKRPEAGTAYLAATSDHLVVDGEGCFHYTAVPANARFRPSVSVCFSSLAEHWPSPGVAALLTGMGRDGAEGLARMRARGWATLAQDEASSVVYGMPKAAVELGAVERVLPLDDIAAAIVSRVKRAQEAARP